MPVAISYGDGSYNVLSKKGDEAAAICEGTEEVKCERALGDKRIKLVRIKPVEVEEILL
ncbi:hypothetical protein H8A97_30410 [Bradyrhizobium sp. Arg62]|uniref:hypothetical protein n=1 Tax=Bradyrhizobium brasilense TaxID=1419277 RepID=UPI001E5632FE|nr:hypothetical protein [Bradyrhizobium brasilense]MCC8949299.1 hypothetical protein [Bradyrhizobium brasilense]